MAGINTLSGNSHQEKTFQYEETLPSLPVPPLDKTMQRYLESVKPVLTAEEYQQTVKVVADFEKCEGLDLHNKLVQKAKTSKNWLEQWWEDKAYMEVRAPAAILCNLVGIINTINDIWPPTEGTQLERAAIYTWHWMQHFLLLRREQVPIDKSRDGKTVWSMEQNRGLFCTGREPGIERDTLHRHFKTESEGDCPNHLVVFSNGHCFLMKPFTESGELLSSHELYRQYTYIKEHSMSTRGQGVGALSADNRTAYAKAYNHLVQLDPCNRKHMKTIEGAIGIVQLQEGSPKNMTELYQMAIYGPNVYNRYFDKSYGLLVYDNGCFAANADHAPADGIVIVNHFFYIHQQIIKTAGTWTGSNRVDPDLVMPEELIFTMDTRVMNDIAMATETYNKNALGAEFISITNSSMGKKWIRAQGIHPDAFVQLCFQFTYYRMYGKPAPTYETATTRKFYHGRTETVRSCTMEAVDWSKAMIDRSISNTEKLKLFKKAHDKHLQLLKECATGEGIDRHLLGLLAIAQEEGQPTPKLYTDLAFTKSGGGGNFTLSTSLTGYTGILGAVMAMTHDGYGLFYCFTDDSIKINISAYKTCPETDVNRFFDQFNRCLMDMQRMLLSAKI